jgi:hypothetical protein
MGFIFREPEVDSFRFFWQVRDLEGELDGMRRKSRDVLQQAVWAERERMTSLQWELDDCRVALQSTEETIESLKVCLTSFLIFILCSSKIRRCHFSLRTLLSYKTIRKGS